MEVVDVHHPVLREFQATTNNTHGVDTSHKCEVARCRYWGSTHFRHTYVCCASLHIHQCRRDCSLSEQVTSGVYICPISGIENAQIYVAYATRVTARGGGERFVDTMTWSGTGGRSKLKKKLKGFRCQSNQVATVIFDILRCTAMQPVRSTIRTVPFQQIMLKMFSDAAAVKRPSSQLCGRIADYINDVYHLMKPKSSVPTLVAVVFSFLAEGLILNDVCVIPRDEWCSARAPKLTAYAQVPGIQCRPMSTATRALKRAIGSGGEHVSSVFIFPS